MRLSRAEERLVAVREGTIWLVSLALIYALVSFAWSAMALLIPYRLPVTPEYQPGFLATEVTGHFVFGLAAGLFFGRARLAALCGFLAVAIDTDHLLSVTVSPVLDRSAHSVLFIVVAATALSFAAARGRRLDSGVFFVTISSVLTHFSYDALLSNGKFPLLFPASIQISTFPQVSWVVFEGAAIAVALLWRARGALRLAQQDDRGPKRDKEDEGGSEGDLDEPPASPA